ncbi:MAG TPA: glycoside hydrolase family 15 protein [Solirubrobacteraceae bacterium]|nr:glycoside hydrolase family 15 protein [Solirubrobacteraceae bacterium]
MPLPLEDYALIGDLQTAALVGRDGSIDWLCFPRFDSGACFAALLGDERHGRWRIAPAGEVRAVRRRYRPGTLVLETELDTDDGTVRLVDCMPPRDRAADLVRVVQGVRGRVPMRLDLAIRFDYGAVVPWVRRRGSRLHAVAGPDSLWLQSDVELRGEDLRTVGEFSVAAGDEAGFVLSWEPSYGAAAPPRRAAAGLRATTRWWERWSSRCAYDGPYRDAVLSSLIVLKALTYAPSGGIVAAPTTSLPEQLGGPRNWDYRYCWVRDATFTLMALMEGGYLEEARAWRDWLLRAVAAQPTAMRIMYGPGGERRLPEQVIDWLPGYEGSAPVRIGNAASNQFQLDVYGELFDALHQARVAGLEAEAPAWEMQRVLLEFLEDAWRQPDDGIWEVRGGRQDFVHSKAMAWVAFDRAIATVERFGNEGPVDRWRAQRAALREEILRRGFDAERNTFVQAYGSTALDGALLMLPLVGFLAPEDPRVVGTVAAIQRELVEDGFVLRYRPEHTDDGLPGGEGSFLPCTFWLVECLALLGRRDEATALFERLLGLRNDVGLLSEEYDTRARRLVGNFPQAFSHVGLVNSAAALGGSLRQAERAG